MKLLKWLSVADRFTKTYLDSRFAPLGINSSQHMYLLKVCSEPGILQDSMLDIFYVHPSNIIRMLSALEKNGFLVREPYEKDKRTYRLYPTDKAKNICEQVQIICQDAEQMLMEGISEQEQDDFARILLQAGKRMAQQAGLNEKEDGFDE